MTQCCYSFTVSYDLFGAFNFTVGLADLFGLSSQVLASYDFLGFRLKCLPRQTDLNQIMTQTVSRRLESIQLMTQTVFQELAQNQLMTQVDSHVLIKIDS